jgi:flagellar biosynthesis anti-sigma factor FlgM
MIDPLGSYASEVLNDRTTERVKPEGRTTLDRNSGVRSTIAHGEAAVTSLVSTAMQTPNARQERVNSLRTSIQQGDYAIDARKIASAMLQDQLI